MSEQLKVPKHICEQCIDEYDPPNPLQPHQRFCSAACRLKAWRKKKSESQQEAPTGKEDE